MQGMPVGERRLEKMPLPMMSWQQMVLIAGNLSVVCAAGGTWSVCGQCSCPSQVKSICPFKGFRFLVCLLIHFIYIGYRQSR